MKTKTYLVTTGDYEDFKILNQITGPASPALSTLHKKFLQEYVVPKPRPIITMTTYMERQADIARVVKVLQEEGCEGYNLAELFVSWVTKNHGFAIEEWNEFYI